jgi:hypothetical protein
MKIIKSHFRAESKSGSGFWSESYSWSQSQFVSASWLLSWPRFGSRLFLFWSRSNRFLFRSSKFKDD